MKTTRRLPKSGWRLFCERRGAALVEMAVVLPVFITVILGIIEFGRAMMVANLITNAAREGARMAVVDGSSNAAVQSYISGFMQSAANVGAGDVTVIIKVNGGSADVSTAQPRDEISVKVSIPFTKVSYLTPSYLSSTTLQTTSYMRHE